MPRSRGKLFVHLKSSSDFQIIRLSNVGTLRLVLCLCQGLGDALVVVQHRGDGVVFFSQSFPISGHHGGCFSGDALVMDYFLNDFVFAKNDVVLK